MTLNRQGQLFGRDAMTIIEYPNESRATRLDIHVNGTRARIERILNQFFDEGSRPLHHLARSDLVDERARQQSNRHDFLELSRASGSAIGCRSHHRARRIARLSKA